MASICRHDHGSLQVPERLIGARATPPEWRSEV
jgi:hypothetical protein